MFKRRSSIALFAAAGLVFSVGSAKADPTVQITVQEGTESGGVFTPTGPSIMFTGSTVSTTSYHITSGLTSSVALNNGNFGALQTNLGLGLTQNWTNGAALQFTITGSGYSNTLGSVASLTNTTSDSFTSSSTSVNGFTVTDSATIIDPSTSTSIATTSTSTAVASLTPGSSPPAGSGSSPAVSIPLTGLPGTYSIQQLITAYYSDPTTTVPSALLNATIDSSIQPAITAVPAPGALALAMVGLPLLGARRLLNRGKAQSIPARA